MAGKVLRHNLEYCDDGEIKTKTLEVHFISHAIIREFNRISQIVCEMQHKYDSLSDVLSLISASTVNGDPTEELEMKRDEIIKSFSSYNEDELLKMRFDLTKKILNKNGIKEGSMMTFEFWDENVEPSEHLDFLEKCAYKDIDKKKIM